MSNYKEIVTKAVVSKGKKLFTSTNNVMGLLDARNVFWSLYLVVG